MKKFLKALAVFACAIALVAGSVAATLAYLTDTETVTNTFTVGNVSITLTDTSTDEYLSTDGSYKLVPGHIYGKTATISVVEGSEDCYLFVKLDNGLGEAATFAVDTENWVAVPNETNVYAYKAIAKAKDTCVISAPFTLASNADVEELASATISVTAYAVQADGFEDAEDAWEKAESEFAA